jgi:hypothetical protein
LNVPNPPAFGRQAFKHEIVPIVEGAFDDTCKHNGMWLEFPTDHVDTLNTQSGTQWDGFRHVSHLATKTFYNNVTAEDIKSNDKAGIHYISQHGIAGRGILLDYWGYAQKKGKTYDCFERHEITWDELAACGQDQGIDIRPESQGGNIKIGDLLFIRSGFTDTYAKKDFSKAATRSMEEQKWAGLANEEKIIDWLYDCYFATVAGDAPAFEAWPPQGGKFFF